MKRAAIKLGGEYAVKVPGRYRGDKAEVVRATVIKPCAKNWTVLAEGDAPAADRTHEVTSQALVQPWTDYCMDTAHHEALHEDSQREWHAEYEAERAAFAERAEPLIDAFRGITIPGASVTSSNRELPDRDLGEYLHDTFVGDRVTGTTFTFDTFAAIGKQILELREAVLLAGSGWVSPVGSDE